MEFKLFFREFFERAIEVTEFFVSQEINSLELREIDSIRNGYNILLSTILEFEQVLNSFWVVTPF